MSLWFLVLILAPNVLAYLIHQALLEWYFKERNLKHRYNAKWGLVTGASSGTDCVPIPNPSAKLFCTVKYHVYRRNRQSLGQQACGTGSERSAGRQA